MGSFESVDDEIGIDDDGDGQELDLAHAAQTTLCAEEEGGCCGVEVVGFSNFF